MEPRYRLIFQYDVRWKSKDSANIITNSRGHYSFMHTVNAYIDSCRFSSRYIWINKMILDRAMHAWAWCHENSNYCQHCSTKNVHPCVRQMSRISGGWLAFSEEYRRRAIAFTLGWTATCLFLIVPSKHVSILSYVHCGRGKMRIFPEVKLT